VKGQRHALAAFTPGKDSGNERAKVKVSIVQALRFCRGRTAHRGVEVMLYYFMTNGTRKE
jgi:hypothetical protein